MEEAVVLMQTHRNEKTEVEIIHDLKEFLNFTCFCNNLGLYLFHFPNNTLLQINLALKCKQNNNFPIKLFNIGFVANDKWRQVLGFDLLHHIY